VAIREDFHDLDVDPLFSEDQADPVTVSTVRIGVQTNAGALTEYHNPLFDLSRPLVQWMSLQYSRFMR